MDRMPGEMWLAPSMGHAHSKPARLAPGAFAATTVAGRILQRELLLSWVSLHVESGRSLARASDIDAYTSNRHTLRGPRDDRCRARSSFAATSGSTADRDALRSQALQAFVASAGRPADARRPDRSLTRARSSGQRRDHGVDCTRAGEEPSFGGSTHPDPPPFLRGEGSNRGRGGSRGRCACARPMRARMRGGRDRETPF